MSGEPPPSFSVGRRWAIFFSVLVSMIAVTAVVIMVNYLGARYYMRGNFSSQGRMQLSPMTLGLLKSVTNDVKVTVYYDRDDSLYSLVTAMLDEYRLANPKISVRTVDYKRDVSEAVKVKSTYNLTAAEAKNLVIFECDRRYQVLDGKFLADIDYAAVANDTQPEYERKIRSFKGEQEFSDALFRVLNPKPMNAGFLTGQREFMLDDESGDGYSQFKAILQNKFIRIANLSLEGTNTVPADCSLLIIAGPRRAFPPEQIDKIRQHLAQGGRLLVMFHFDAVYNHISTGLEALLAEWGLDAGMNWIKDPDNTESGDVMAVKEFNPNHPVVKPLAGQYSLGLLRPRSIRKLGANQQNPEGLKVDELAFTGKVVKLNDDELATRGPLPVMAAVEKGGVKGVFSERGSTRIVAVGDSIFLSNRAIIIAENADFAALAVNWLLDQNQLMEGIGPHRVIDSRLLMTRAQMRNVEWIFLGGMPGAVLLLGGLVWLRRRR
jgi:ABC-2 type transport system permease protein